MEIDVAFHARSSRISSLQSWFFSRFVVVDRPTGILWQIRVWKNPPDWVPGDSNLDGTNPSGSGDSNSMSFSSRSRPSPSRVTCQSCPVPRFDRYVPLVAKLDAIWAIVPACLAPLAYVL